MKATPQSGLPLAEGLAYKIVRKRVKSLKPSPENVCMYTLADIEELADSIRERGLLELPVVTEDGFIAAGHRRHAALLHMGQAWVRCRVLAVRRDAMTTDEYIALLREYNRYRDKTVPEQVREQLIDADPAEARLNLGKARSLSVYAPEYNGIKTVEIEGVSRRPELSEDKAEHIKYAKQVIFEDRKDYWPLSVRGVHYPLLNYDFIRGYWWPRKIDPGYGTRVTRYYKNDGGSYDATSDLLARLRFDGIVPWEALDDFTRPVEVFHAFQDVKHFVRQEMDRLFDGYWRDLLQSQPNHVEILCEKNTIYHMVLRVARKYQITTSSGRGFNSVDPWHDLYVRYKDSGKRRLILIVLSDYDPEGEMIPQVGGRTLLYDFHVSVADLTIIKAGVTREQIDRYQLPIQNFAKEESSNLARFLKRTGGDRSVYELEALEPGDMLRDLDAVARGVLDLNFFNAEVARQREETAWLATAHRTAIQALKGLIV